MRMPVTIIALILTGCSQASPPPQTTEFLGHHLGETTIEWKLIENPFAPDPVEVCQDIIKSGAAAETDQYKDCAKFLVSGEYSITMRDWKTRRERTFRFEGWRLAMIMEKFQASEYDAVKKDLTRKFGVPENSQPDSASWQKPDAKIEVLHLKEDGATFVSGR
jgi:tRNA U54 and U55 pseudouridine synthase Pus10